MMAVHEYKWVPGIACPACGAVKLETSSTGLRRTFRCACGASFALNDTGLSELFPCPNRADKVV